MKDLVERVRKAMLAASDDLDMRMVPGRHQWEVEIPAAIAAVLDDLENPDEHMLEAFWRRFDKGPDPESFNTLLGDALAAAFRAKRKELGLASPETPEDTLKGNYGAQAPTDG